MTPDARPPEGPVGSTPAAVRIDAPAKINLALRILERRPDGYHELDTLFQAISLADEVLIVPRDAAGVGLTVVDADVGPVENNLALRAARAWADASGIDPRVHIRLTKRIPAGAGLGGGSSDAGAVLRGLESMYGAPLGTDRIAAIGAEIGADVPFFCGSAGLARGRGIGDRLEPLAALPARDLIVVVPPVPVPTAGAYGWLSEVRRTESDVDAPTPESLADAAQAPTWPRVERALANDFHDVVAARVPEVAAAVGAMAAAGLRHVLLSGSGSAVFGFPGREAAGGTTADAAAAHLRAALPDARVFRATTLTDVPEPIPAAERA